MKSTGSNLILIIALLVLCLMHVGIASGQAIHETVLWKSSTGNYKGYRIPSAIVTSKGTILAFAEGRNDSGNSGDIDLVLKRSKNNGRTWENEIVVWNDSLNTCGNPCPVVDQVTGRIWLLMTWNDGKDHENEIICRTARSTRIPYICYSDDDGQNWSKPVECAATCKDPSWGWYATGPGIGIQLKNAKYGGRLVVPANHSYDDPESKIRKDPHGYGSHVLISDDHGKSWRMGSPIRPGCNESQVVELSDGTLLMNMRSYNGKNCRAISLSQDGGETWSPVQQDYQLVEPVCQASIIDWGSYKGHQIYLFSNPAVPAGRTHMTLKCSTDGCRTWNTSKLIYAGPSAYSGLVRLPKNQIGLLFEKGTKDAYEKISFVTVELKSLIGSGDIQVH
jgi:sialidase-1